MSEITTTIAKLQKNFIAWHTEYYADLHADTIDYIESELESIRNDNNENVTTINNQIVTIGQFLSKSINGSSNITSVAQIANELKNKNNDWGTGNLESLNNRTAINTEDINTLKGLVEKFVTESDVTSLISANGMKTIAINSGDSLNNYKNFGFYKSNDLTITNSIQEKPDNVSEEPFVLIVIDANKDTSSNNIKQILLTINTNKIFIRSCVRGSWNATWQEVYTTNNTSTIDMEVQFESDGSTQTYTLLKK